MKLPEFLSKKPIKYGLAGFACSVMVWGAWKIAVPIVHEYQSSFAAKEFRQYGIWGTYQRRFFQTASRLDELRTLDQENEELNRKIAGLEKEITLEHAGQEEKAAQMVAELANKQLMTAAGSELARSLDTIDYQVPERYLPQELFTLGLGYFRKNEYEKAAVIFTYLVELKEEAGFQKPENLMLCGIAWFKIDHFKLAERYFAQAKKKTQPQDGLYKKIILWDAFVAQAMGHKPEAQKVLTGLMERFPHAEEVQWVNRGPATDSETDIKKEPEHAPEHSSHDAAPSAEHSEGGHHE